MPFIERDRRPCAAIRAQQTDALPIRAWRAFYTSTRFTAAEVAKVLRVTMKEAESAISNNLRSGRFRRVANSRGLYRAQGAV
jgi:hypothetical protein